MSRQGMIIAKQYGEDLPRFESLSAAKAALLGAKEETVGALLDEHGETLTLDLSPESLKRLEKWYIESGSPEAGSAGYSMPHAIGFYFGEVLCKVGGFSWVVEEFTFQRGRYEIGVSRPLLSIMLTKGMRPTTNGNKRDAKPMAGVWAGIHSDNSLQRTAVRGPRPGLMRQVAVHGLCGGLTSEWLTIPSAS
jgi:hypothetical protein